MYKFELGSQVILLAWRGEVPYAGSLEVLETEFKGESWNTGGLIEQVHGMKLGSEVKFDRELLEKELHYVKSELQDIRTLDKFSTRTECECRTTYLKESDLARADITGEFAVFLNIWRISARVKVKVIKTTESNI